MSVPITRELVSAARQEEIRNRVRAIEFLSGAETVSELATLNDAEALCTFLSHPGVHAPIYSLPTEFNNSTISSFIAQHLAQRERGEGLLFVRKNITGEIIGFSEVKVWPQWAAGELTGALRPDHQSKGQGTAGVKTTFGWMFPRSDWILFAPRPRRIISELKKLLTALGFAFKGVVDRERPDGTMRPSKVWEMTRSNWHSR